MESLSLRASGTEVHAHRFQDLRPSLVSPDDAPVPVVLAARRVDADPWMAPARLLKAMGLTREKNQVSTINPFCLKTGSWNLLVSWPASPGRCRGVLGLLQLLQHPAPRSSEKREGWRFDCAAWRVKPCQINQWCSTHVMTRPRADGCHSDGRWWRCHIAGCTKAKVAPPFRLQVAPGGATSIAEW